MAPEVIEKDIDLSEANATQDTIYEDQFEKFPDEHKPLPPEDVQISKENLEADYAAHVKTLEESSKQGVPYKAESAQSTMTGEVPQGFDQSPEPEPVVEEKKEEEPERSPQEILEALGLKHEPKTRTITDGQNSREYIQTPLSFIGKIQFLSYIGEVLDKAMAGENALKLNSLFDVPTRGDVLSAQDLSDAQTFVQAIGKLLVYAPDFLSKSYCIWLRIPEYEREWAVAAMEQSLSDEEGFDIIETFVDQNWETLQNFFADKLPNLSKRLQARYRASQSEQ